MASGRPALIDAHMHLWELERLSYPWLTPPFRDDGPNGDVSPIARTYLLADYLRDAAGWEVAGAVHVEAGAAPAQALEETRWIQAVADAAPFPLAHVAYVPLHDPKVERLLAAQAAFPAVRGVRQILNWHPDARRTYSETDRLTSQEFQRGFALLARHGLSFDLQIYPGQMLAAAELAGRHPETPMVLNHAGMARAQDGAELALWREGLAALARRPNVFVKLSGFGLTDPGWTADGVAPLVDGVLDRFGPDRVMVASDVPTDKLHGDFDHLVGTLDRLTTGLGEAGRRAVFHETARRVYRLDAPTRTPEAR